jgi:hypothetical protein
MPGSLGHLAVALLGLAPPGDAKALSKELEPPVRLEAGGKVIDTDVGHAAPFVGDFYGRGVNDLLVGQFGDGILWVFPGATGTGVESPRGSGRGPSRGSAAVPRR